MSSTLQEEYDELLCHAVVVPNFDGRAPYSTAATSSLVPPATPSSHAMPSASDLMLDHSRRSPLMADADGDTDQSTEAESSGKLDLLTELCL